MGWPCAVDDKLFFQGVADDVLQLDEDGYPQFKEERVDEIIWEETKFGRADPVLDTWTVVLVYILTDYKYLFL